VVELIRELEGGWQWGGIVKSLMDAIISLNDLESA
jgi:hypothetical protein